MNVSAQRAIEILGGLITYRQLDYWQREGCMEFEVQAAGQGSVRRLSLQDVLRLRMIGLLAAEIGSVGGNHAWTVRDHINAATEATPEELRSSVTYDLGRVQIAVDLTIDPEEEPMLAEWIATGQPPFRYPGKTAA